MDNLVLSGGGIKIFSTLGVLKYFEEKNVSFIRYITSSASAMVIFLNQIGLKVNEIINLLLEIEIDKLIKPNLLNLVNKCGLDDKKGVEHFLRTCLKKKTGKEDITFKELYELSGKEFVCNSSDINNSRIIYFDKFDYPDFSVIDAVLISGSYPLLFEKKDIEDMSLIDGGLLDPFPSNYIIKKKLDKNKTFGISLKNNSVKKCEDIESFFLNSISCMNNVLYDYNLNIIKDVLTIDTGIKNCIELNISKQYKEDLIKIGYNAIKKSKLRNKLLKR